MTSILTRHGKHEKAFIKKIITKSLKAKIINVIIKKKRGLLMEDIEIEFSNQICTFCTYNNFEKCGEIHTEKRNDLSICKCLNYRRKEIAMKEFSEYINYTYYDELGNHIAIIKRDIPEEIFKQLKFRYDEVKNSETNKSKCL